MLVSCQPIFHPCPVPCLCRHHAFDAWQKKHLPQQLLLTVGVLSPGGMILAENKRNTYVNQTVLDFPSFGFTALGQCSRLLLTSWRGQGPCRIESLLINLDICSLAEPEYSGSVGPRISRSKARHSVSSWIVSSKVQPFHPWRPAGSGNHLGRQTWISCSDWTERKCNDL
jgi:hypothetical protein